MKKILLAFLLLSSPLLGDDTSGDTGGSSPDYSEQLWYIIDLLSGFPDNLYYQFLLENVNNVSTLLVDLRGDLFTPDGPLGETVDYIRKDVKNIKDSTDNIESYLSPFPEFMVNMEGYSNVIIDYLEGISSGVIQLSGIGNSIYDEQVTLNETIYQLLEKLGELKDQSNENDDFLSNQISGLLDKLTVLSETTSDISTTLNGGDTNVDVDLDEVISKLTTIITDWNDRWRIMEPFYNHFYENSTVAPIWYAPKFSSLAVNNDVKNFDLTIQSEDSEPARPRGFFQILYQYFENSSRSNADQTKALMYITKYMSQENKSQEFEDELESQTQEIENKQSQLEESLSLSSYLENFSFEKYEELYNWGEILEPLRGYVNNENVITLGYFSIPGYEAGIDWKIDINGLSKFTDFTRNLFKVVYYFLYALLIWWVLGKIYPLFFRLFDKFCELTYA